MTSRISKLAWSLLAAAAGLAFATQAGAAGIATTKHDLSTKGWGSNQICIFCHAPHNTGTTAPLWNHTESTATYTMYTSNTLNATGLGVGAGSVSKLCLSCHDGTVALDSFGGASGSSGSGLITGDANLSNNLSNDHPIGFTYDGTLASADGGLVTPASTSLVVTGIPLYGGKLECSSCHAVHDNTNAPFLRNTNAGSALCLKCHNK